jgi:hypothetical protein
MRAEVIESLCTSRACDKGKERGRGRGRGVEGDRGKGRGTGIEVGRRKGWEREVRERGR